MTTAVQHRLVAARRVHVRVDARTLVVLGISALLLVSGLALFTVHEGAAPLLAAPTIPWWAIALAFALTETCVMHTQVNREARTVSLSELPLVLGLFLAAPSALMAGRLVGVVVIAVGHRKAPPLKTTFNLALTVAETGVAVLVFRAVAGAATGPEPLTWLAAFAAAFTANLVGSAAINLVISVYEGGLSGGTIFRDAYLNQTAVPLGVTLALIAVTSLTAVVESAWLLVALGVLFLLAYRAYGALTDRHTHLERLYQFSQAVSSATEIDGVMASVLEEARQLLHAERASAAFLGPDGAIIARIRLDADSGLERSEEPATEDDEWLLRQVVHEGAPLMLPRAARGPGRRWLDLYGMRDAIAVPLRGNAGTLGALVVSDRLGDVRSFESGDLLLLETVANHAGVALQNGELIDKLQHEALHDALTGLPNRVQLMRRLAAALDDVAAERSPGAAVMILDLDGFKDINDTLGHQQGDLLLTEVGARLTAVVGSSGSVARLGGDEFAVLVTGTADEDRVLHVGRRVLRALEQPVALDELEVEVGGSLGVAFAPRHATDPAALLKRADMAMYDAKMTARRLRVFEPELDNDNPRRLTLVAELRAALHSGGITVHVQPQTRLSTGEVAGVEALARWTHPTLGAVPPAEFIPIAERSGLIGPLTTRVLDAALAGCARWRAEGVELAVAVNLSARSLHDPDLVEEVARLLHRHAVPARLLTLEVTEGAVMADPTRAVALLHQLRELGVRLSVDDFGTGYSSLAYLKRLPVQEVKIDQSFVTSLGSDAGDLPIVRAIVDLGRHMDLEVVAEGIEDAETAELLDTIGCDLGQGWHLGRPMPVEALLPWLRTRAPAVRTRGPLRLV